MMILSMEMRGTWIWLMVTLVNVICSQQICPESCLQCDQYMRCLKCVDGYYGERCTACDPACRNGRCRVDGSCDGNIDRAVQKKRRIRRNSPANCHDTACTCCVSNYRGPSCQVECPNCRTRYSSEVCHNYCEAGFHGETCEKTCPQNCAPGNAGKPICKQATGECWNNCQQGYFGKMCNSTCPSDCKHGYCRPVSGNCDECSEKRYGEKCEIDCQSCKERCSRNGTCVNGCEDGYHGPLCNLGCGTDCSEGGKCRLFKGDRENICATPCQYIPASHNVHEDCVDIKQPAQRSLDAGVIAAVVIAPIVLIISLIVLILLGSDAAQEEGRLVTIEKRTSEVTAAGNGSGSQDEPLNEGDSDVGNGRNSPLGGEYGATASSTPGETAHEDKPTENDSDGPEKPLLPKGATGSLTPGRPKAEDQTTGISSDGPKDPPLAEGDSDVAKEHDSPPGGSNGGSNVAQEDNSPVTREKRTDEDKETEDAEQIPPGIVGTMMKNFESKE